MIEKQLGIYNMASLNKKQLKKRLSSPLFILTGGPGTGKTTVINGIVNRYLLS
jgi:exodeoxyribonuclease V alpha subunit